MTVGTGVGVGWGYGRRAGAGSTMTLMVQVATPSSAEAVTSMFVEPADIGLMTTNPLLGTLAVATSLRLDVTEYVGVSPSASTKLPDTSSLQGSSPAVNVHRWGIVPVVSGGSLTRVMVTLTVPVAVPPFPSETV